MPDKTPHFDTSGHQLTDSLIDGKIIRGVLWALLAGLLFGGLGILVQQAKGQIPASEMVFTRCVIGVVGLAPWVWYRLGDVWGPAAPYLWVRGLAGAGSMSAYFWTLQNTAYGTAVALTLLAGIFIVVFSALWLGEKVSLPEAGAIGVVLLGALLLYLPDSTRPSGLVTLVGVVGSVCGAAALLSLRRVAGMVDSLVIVWFFYLVTMVVSLVTPSDPWVWPAGLRLWGIVLGVGLAGLFAQIFLTWSFRWLRAPIASSLVLSRMLWGILIEMVFFWVVPSSSEWFSYGLMLAGVILLSMLQRQPARAEEGA